MKPALNGSANARGDRIGHRDDCLCPTCGQAVSAKRYAAIIGEQAAHDAEVERTVEARFAAREATVRREATEAAKAVLAPKLAEAVEAKRQMKELQASFESALKRQLEAQESQLVKLADERVNAEKTLRHSDSLRYQQALEELKRKHAKERPQELGDRGELDLFETLTAEFPSDQITRVGKGVRGPDVVQRVFSGGVFTGRTIIYDAKNHKAWQSKWVGKLRADQIEAQADHGVLVSTTFPSGRSQLMVENGVVVCSPARATAVASMLRRHVLQTHALRLSNADRDEKSAKLYELLTSDRAAERWERVSSATTELVEIEASDAAHQQRTRDKRLSKVRAIVAVHDEFIGDIDGIVRGDSEDSL